MIAFAALCSNHGNQANRTYFGRRSHLPKHRTMKEDRQTQMNKRFNRAELI